MMHALLRCQLCNLLHTAAIVCLPGMRQADSHVPISSLARAGVFACGLMTAFSAAPAEVLLDTTFASNSQSPPASVRWIASGGGLSIDGMLTQTPNNNQREVLAYISPVTVAEGQTLTLEFVFSVDNPKNAGGAAFGSGCLIRKAGPRSAR